MKWILSTALMVATGLPLMAQKQGINEGANNRFSRMQLAATDALGRRIEPAQPTKGPQKQVGIFYSAWLGQHQSGQRGIYDIQRMLDTDPTSLHDPAGNAESPLNEFHFWGEPLYGYYSMSDPWIVVRHIELLTQAGIDYLCIDATNNVIYETPTHNLLATLLKFQRQGFAVPKVVFYTNSHSGVAVEKLYNAFYKSGQYEDVWLKPEGKPMIIGITENNGNASDQTRFEAMLHPPDGFTEYITPEMQLYFDVRESQWPNGEYNENSIPWMSWQHPQWNHSGTVAVPVAQHSHSVIYASSMHPECNRGYDNASKEVNPNWAEGTSFQTMWNGVFESTEPVDNVLVTSFNEWMAIKYVNDANEVFFVDVYNAEYSRDIEMMKGGYADNFYLQLAQNVRKFKFEPKSKTHRPSKVKIDIHDLNPRQWAKVKESYVDFAGDAIPRNFENAAGTGTYTDNSNRNDIVEIKVAHDRKNLYFRIETLADITSYNGRDQNWMNILIRTHGAVETNFAGYNYIVNRNPGAGKTSVERSTGGYEWTTSGEADYVVSGNVMQVAIPLQHLSLAPGKCQIEFKVADNVTNFDDIMDYYVTGDSAPIGRLSYSYGK